MKPDRSPEIRRREFLAQAGLGLGAGGLARAAGLDSSVSPFARRAGAMAYNGSF